MLACVFKYVCMYNYECVHLYVCIIQIFACVFTYMHVGINLCVYIVRYNCL